MKKYILGLILISSFLISTPAMAAGLSETQIQSIISILTAFGVDSTTRSEVNAVLRGQVITTARTSGTSCVTLNNNLYADTTDDTTDGEVSKLQQFLGGRVTGYFGPLTLQLVQEWQAAHGIVSFGSPDTTGYGYAGPKTRAAMSCASNSISEANSVTSSQPNNLPIQNTQAATTTATATSTSPVIVPAVTSATSTTQTIPVASVVSDTPSVPAIPAQSTITATTTAADTDTISPSAPTGLTASGITQSQIHLSWTSSTDNVGVAGYKVYRDGTQISTVTGSNTSTTGSYTDTNLQTSTAYTYTIAAYDAAGNVSASSNPVSATTEAPPPPPTITVLSPVTGQSFASGSEVSISWQSANAPSGAVVALSYASCNDRNCPYYFIQGGQELGTTNNFAFTGISTPGQWYVIVTLRSASGTGSYTLDEKSVPITITEPSISTASPINKSPVSFLRDLAIGSSGSDVKQLQTLLAREVGYSADLVTGYFGRITHDAVKKLQEKYGVVPTSGYFGDITRKALTASVSNW